MIGEHFFSTMLSSPYTTQKLANGEEDRRMVHELLYTSTGISLVVAGITSWYIDEKWPLIFTFILCIFYIVMYELALDGKL